MQKPLLIALFSLSFSCLASLTPEQTVDKVKKACGQDMEKYCAHIQNKISSEGNTCQVENKKKLDPECSKVLHELKIYLQGSMKR